MFQSYALFPHMTVAQNIAFPLRMARRPAAEISGMTRDILEQVHLTDKAVAYPHELSGGQKQRVALACGLVNRPRLLLLDEPLGALDAKLREEMQIDLINLQREIGVTFVFVTHAQVEALRHTAKGGTVVCAGIHMSDVPGFPYSILWGERTVRSIANLTPPAVMARHFFRSPPGQASEQRLKRSVWSRPARPLIALKKAAYAAQPCWSWSRIRCAVSRLIYRIVILARQITDVDG